MGDFASPTAGGNGGLCINNSLNNSVPPGSVGIPKHSTVVERLRQRIEGCRRHHVTCETRYQQAHAEQLEIERRETVSLYQRSLEQRAKKSAPGSTKQPQSKQLESDSAVCMEQRNNTLIASRARVFSLFSNPFITGMYKTSSLHSLLKISPSHTGNPHPE
uniref:Neurogenic mastermind-like N-terminal domain-containing protein n=1 Tax=Knipowitschia caucasica TaxID=637954 RepID=A0AAV2LPH5_KNICA